MLRADRQTQAIATSLSFIAGYVDAVGFLGSGGFFVSFMSGNSTRLGVGLASGVQLAVTAALLIGAFLIGVIAASLLNRWVHHRQSVLLGLIALLVALSAAVGPLGGGVWRFVPLAMAMGAENMVFERDGEVRIGLTYMTGTLVKVGQRIASALAGGPRWDWLPFALLWAGLILGGAAGAVAYARLGLGALWVPSALAMGLSIWVRRALTTPAAAAAREGWR